MGDLTKVTWWWLILWSVGLLRGQRKVDATVEQGSAQNWGDFHANVQLQ